MIHSATGTFVETVSGTDPTATALRGEGTKVVLLTTNLFLLLTCYYMLKVVREPFILLGGAFAVCAAPCIGPVLAAILVLAGSSDTALQGAALLGVYSLGLAVPFVLAAALFTRAMSAFRWLRDHYRVIQIGGGAVMVALGLLLFFERFYVLRVYLNRFLERVGLEPAF